MKKLLFLFAAIGLLLVVSCGEGPPQDPEPPKIHDTSLAGTTWKGWSMYDTFDESDGGGGTTESEVVFTDSAIDFINITKPYIGDERVYELTGTYLYNPPVLKIFDADGTDYYGSVSEEGGKTILYLKIRGAHFVLVLKETEIQ